MLINQQVKEEMSNDSEFLTKYSVSAPAAP
jgi:hypothetical protein